MKKRYSQTQNSQEVNSIIMDGGIKDFPRFYWEFIRDGFEIENPNISEPLPGPPSLLKIWRDDEYNLEGSITGIAKSTGFGPARGNIPGSLVPLFDIKGMTDRQEIYEIDGCYTKSISYSSKEVPIIPSQPPFRYHIGLGLRQIKIALEHDKSSKWWTDWYINATDKPFVFYRYMSIEISQRLTQKRSNINDSRILENQTETSSMNYAFVQCPDFSFIIHKVPKEFQTGWSNGIGIEYGSERGRIPTDLERNAISEIVSFLFGKQLLKVGHLSLHEDNRIVEMVSTDHLARDAKRICKSGGRPPIRLDGFENGKTFETVLSTLIPKYFVLRDELKLDEVLWRFWVGSRLPIGVNIPIIASGIEILARSWLESSQSDMRSVYMEKNEFEKLLEKELSAIEVRLGTQKYRDRMIRRIMGAYNMGSNEKLEFFFEGINLPLGKIENEAMKSRNSMIHGSVDGSDSDFEHLVQLTDAYTTLFHRTILKILGYSGDYVDYSIEGWPTKIMNRAAGT